MGETERASVLPRHDAELTGSNADRRSGDAAICISPENSAVGPLEPDHPYPWQSELAKRLEAYRVRRRKVSPNAAQTQLPFAEPDETKRATATPASRATSVPVAELPAPAFPELQSISSDGSFTSSSISSSACGDDDFAFTIAIGRIATKPHTADGRMMIDVSNSSDVDGSQEDAGELTERAHEGLYPVASLGDRQLAGIIDAACLLFAFGGFVALFGSLGGQLTLSKMNAAVYLVALSVVYFQYFALFTVFGATTPGMMFRGLQVMSFSGDTPTPRQMLLRSAGYMLSAGMCFIGFLWALWDEDQLTWHDRLSKTYLSSAQTYAEVESHSAAHR